MKKIFVVYFLIQSVLIFGQCNNLAVTIPIPSTTFNTLLTQSKFSIQTTNSTTATTVNPTRVIKFDADPINGYVLLNPGFVSTPTTGAFIAEALDGCGALTPSKISQTVAKDEGLKEIMLFPNPVNDYINVNFNFVNNKPFFFSLFDISGRILFEQKFSNESSIYSINLSNFSDSSYIYKIVSDNFEKTGILVKK